MEKKICFLSAILLFVFCALSPAYASNINVTNFQLLNMSHSSSTADIQFDISWDNSWRYGTLLYDAAWVFAKVSVNDGAMNLPKANAGISLIL